MFKIWSFKHVSDSKQNLSPCFKPKLIIFCSIELVPWAKFASSLHSGHLKMPQKCTVFLCTKKGPLVLVNLCLQLSLGSHWNMLGHQVHLNIVSLVVQSAKCSSMSTRLNLFSHLGHDTFWLSSCFSFFTCSERSLGPNSIGNFWLKLWLEKSLEFWLEIPYNKKKLTNG